MGVDIYVSFCHVFLCCVIDCEMFTAVNDGLTLVKSAIENEYKEASFRYLFAADKTEDDITIDLERILNPLRRLFGRISADSYVNLLTVSCQ